MANKSEEYAQKLTAHLGEIFHPANPNQINMKELAHSDNYTAFVHALATMVPLHFHNILAKADLTQLDFNHLANGLIFNEAKARAVEMSKS